MNVTTDMQPRIYRPPEYTPFKPHTESNSPHTLETTLPMLVK